jgi:hypothetical protein
MKHIIILQFIIFSLNPSTLTKKLRLTVNKSKNTIDTLSFVSHSFYNPVSNQTDSTPLITGSQKKIDLNKLKRGILKWCAVSPDLLKRFGGKYKYGDTVYVKSPLQYRGKWIIEDCMNKRYKNKIDFLVY